MVLIKAVVEVGGWEVLQSTELKSQWVPGLLSILVVRLNVTLSDILNEAKIILRSQRVPPQKSCA